jgi:hypothetical protein
VDVGGVSYWHVLAGSLQFAQSYPAISRR